MLSRAEMEGGKVPTTPTTASVIAGIETQEAVKLLHGRQTLEGQGFIFDGALHNSYVVKYKREPDCPSHDAYDPWEVLPLSTATTRISGIFWKRCGDLGKDAVIELNQDVLASLHWKNAAKKRRCGLHWAR